MIHSTQMIVTWSLLGVLLAWMLICAFLACRGLKAEQRGTMDLSTPSGAFFPNVPRTPLHRPASVDMSVGGIPAVSAETGQDVGVVPVA
jgi:hypothetical protein